MSELKIGTLGAFAKAANSALQRMDKKQLVSAIMALMAVVALPGMSMKLRNAAHASGETVSAGVTTRYAEEMAQRPDFKNVVSFSQHAPRA